MMDCLVDTGASSNYISEDMYNKIISSNFHGVLSDCYREEYTGQVKIADTSFVETLGILHVPLFVLDRTIMVPLIILKKLTYDCILGMQFFVTHKVIIDPAEHSIFFQNEPDSLSSIIKLDQVVTLPPFSLQIVSAIIDANSNRDSVVRNLTSFNHRYGFFIAQGPITNGANKINFILNNMTTVRTTIPAGTMIGRLEPLTKYNEAASNIQDTLHNIITDRSQTTEYLYSQPKTTESVQLTTIADLDFNESELDHDQIDKVKNLLDKSICSR